MDPLGARHPHDAWKAVVNDGIKAFNAQIGRQPRRLPAWIMLSTMMSICGQMVIQTLGPSPIITKVGRSGKT
ncbi:hypothetical protein ACE6H2_023105 [Prunus campanulata]